MSLKLNREKYDYCRAKFPWEVGEEMKPETKNPDGKLHGYNIANLLYDGELVRKLLFKPDWVDYGRTYTHIQFHDLQRSLRDGSIDYKSGVANINTIYDKIVKFAENNIVLGVEFNLPESYAALSLSSGLGSGGQILPTEEELEELQESEGSRFRFDQSGGVDFEDTTPEEAVQQLNETFNLKSWTNNKRKLVVGVPETGRQGHVAAPNDDRVWRYKDPSIKHGREPVKTVFVEGSWYDEPGFGTIQDGIKEITAGLTGNKGGADVQAVGIATRTDIPYGSTVTVTDKGALPSALPDIAHTALVEEMKKTNLGTVEIDTNNSGHEVSHPIEIEPGDAIRLVPHDRHFDNPTATSGTIGDRPPRKELCAGFVTNESYFISEVEHNLTETGHWQIYADLATYPNMEIETTFTYYEPSSGEFVEDSDISEDGSLKGSWYSIEDLNADEEDEESAIDSFSSGPGSP